LDYEKNKIKQKPTFREFPVCTGIYRKYMFCSLTKNGVPCMYRDIPMVQNSASHAQGIPHSLYHLIHMSLLKIHPKKVEE
jgi:hypothetical protein